MHHHPMNDLEKFQPHTTSLTQQDWDMLFSLLPAMEKAQTFGVVKGGEQLADGSLSVPFGGHRISWSMYARFSISSISCPLLIGPIGKKADPFLKTRISTTQRLIPLLHPKHKRLKTFTFGSHRNRQWIIALRTSFSLLNSPGRTP